MLPFTLKNNKEDPKFEVGGHVRISKHKSIFAIGCTPNSSDEVFVIKNLKNTVSWTYALSDFNSEEPYGNFYGKELQKKKKKIKKSLLMNK